MLFWETYISTWGMVFMFSVSVIRLIGVFFTVSAGCGQLAKSTKTLPQLQWYLQVRLFTLNDICRYQACYLKWHLKVMLLTFSLLKRFDVSDDFLSLLDIFWLRQVTPYLCIGTCVPRKGSIIRYVECIRKHAHLVLPTPPSKQLDPPSSLSFIVANSPQPPAPFSQLSPTVFSWL